MTKIFLFDLKSVKLVLIYTVGFFLLTTIKQEVAFEIRENGWSQHVNIQGPEYSLNLFV